MQRKWLALLLMPGVLLTQSAALGHRHASGQSSHRDSRPHLHTRPKAAKHEHPHHHGSPHHHHHDEQGNHVAEEPAPADEGTPSPRHDDDALYVSSDVLSCGRPTSDNEVQFLFDSLFTISGCPSVQLPLADQPESRVRPPPFFHPPGTPPHLKSTVLII